MFIPEKEGLKPLKEAHAAIGVKISAHDINEAIAGMPLRAVDNNLNQVIEEIQKQTEETTLEIDNEGIILKADNLGSLEALIKLLKERNIKIKSASIGEITKKDITEASSEYHPLNKIILGFNVKKPETSEVPSKLDETSQAIPKHSIINTVTQKIEPNQLPESVKPILVNKKMVSRGRPRHLSKVECAKPPKEKDSDALSCSQDLMIEAAANNNNSPSRLRFTWNKTVPKYRHKVLQHFQEPPKLVPDHIVPHEVDEPKVKFEELSYPKPRTADSGVPIGRKVFRKD